MHFFVWFEGPLRTLRVDHGSVGFVEAQTFGILLCFPAPESAWKDSTEHGGNLNLLSLFPLAELMEVAEVSKVSSSSKQQSVSRCACSDEQACCLKCTYCHRCPSTAFLMQNDLSLQQMDWQLQHKLASHGNNGGQWSQAKVHLWSSDLGNCVGDSLRVSVAFPALIRFL